MKPHATPMRPTIVHSRAEIADLLRGLRVARGETCEAFDYRAGFSDRYVTKLENGGKPGMRQGFHISPMAEVWLAALGVSLILVANDDEVMSRAVRAPVKVAP